MGAVFTYMFGQVGSMIAPSRKIGTACVLVGIVFLMNLWAAFLYVEKPRWMQFGGTHPLTSIGDLTGAFVAAIVILVRLWHGEARELGFEE